MTRSAVRRLGALALAAAAACPALAAAQAATGDPSGPVPAPERLETFRTVPPGPDGGPLEYRPSAPPAPELAPAAFARLRLLDKMTGQVATFEMRSGEVRTAERLEIALRDCRVPADDARREAVAYLEIRDLREDAPRFAGWMFASSPALSALDHARYDVWVLSCSTDSGEASAGSE